MVGKEDEPLIISLSSTNSEKVSWIIVLVEATVILLNIKTYLGTAPATFTTLPDLDLNPLVASIMQLTPQELLTRRW